jgi:glycosyltransferase involved in cell wall biosynthesis
MKVLFYSPYLNILGGGEHHLFQFASCLSQEHQVYLVWPNPQIVKLAQARFNLDLSSLKILPFLPPRFQLKEFDLLVFVSDGSIPFLPVSKSVLFFMSPFQHVHGRSLINQIKLKFINHIICNSYYTKKFIDAEFKVNSTVIYPAVNLPKSLPQSKQNIILSVGRFSRTLHQKNQEALIQAFIDLEPQLNGWKLVLVGGTEPGSEPVLQPLLDQAKNHPIVIKTDIPNPELHQLYSQTRLYWHAAGFGSDLIKHPQQAEHFGISIVEAMSYGCVPLVFNAGGPKEIITPESGITWNNLDELEQNTLSLIHNPKLRSDYSQAARKQSGFFSQDNLCQNLNSVIGL